ncbi:Leader peptidase PppA [compost metagenome]
MPENKKLITKEFKSYLKASSPNYMLIILNSLIYIGLLYRYGIQDTFIANLDLFKFLLLSPMLITACLIDFRLQIIPNRLNLSIFEIGLVIAFIYGLSNVAITINMLLGMICGGGIFLGITLIGGMIYGKEAMGLGDVKLMGALGLFFGVSNIIVISLLSFLIGAILSVFLLITKIKKTDEYIPFGPFIVIATFISMFVPFDIILQILLSVFTLGLYKK